MAINKLMRLALKALSYPDIDMKKVYPLERTVKEQLKSPHLLKPLYQLWDHKVICAGREILVRIYTVYRICAAVGNPQSARFVEDETFEHFTVSIVNVYMCACFFRQMEKA